MIQYVVRFICGMFQSGDAQKIIKTVDNKITNIKTANNKICLKCHTEISSDAKFCVKCGGKKFILKKEFLNILETKEKQKREDKRKLQIILKLENEIKQLYNQIQNKKECKKCNKIFNLDDKFCSSCGNTLTSINEEKIIDIILQQVKYIKNNNEVKLFLSGTYKEIIPLLKKRIK